MQTEKKAKNILKVNFTKSDPDTYLDTIYQIMFTSYVKKTLMETRKHYFIQERKYMDRISHVDFGEIKDHNCMKIEVDTDLQIDLIIEDVNLFNSIQGLTVKQKTVMYNYYLDEKTEIEISQELKITRQAVNRIRKRALSCIKKHYGRLK
jgi:RNA polymerase sigma factor (sigma-70 family)